MPMRGTFAASCVQAVSGTAASAAGPGDLTDLCLLGLGEGDGTPAPGVADQSIGDCRGLDCRRILARGLRILLSARVKTSPAERLALL